MLSRRGNNNSKRPEEHKIKPWQVTARTTRENGSEVRKTIFKTPREKELARQQVERIGLDCKFGLELLEKGISMSELAILARGSSSEFLKRNGSRLEKKHVVYIREKYK